MAPLQDLRLRAFVPLPPHDCDEKSHDLQGHMSPGAADNMYPRSVDREHRDWINALVHTSGGPSEQVDQLLFAAFECAVEILNDAGYFVIGVDKLNAYQLDLFLFKDMAIGGFLSKFIGRMNDLDIGRYELGSSKRHLPKGHP